MSVRVGTRFAPGSAAAVVALLAAASCGGGAEPEVVAPTTTTAPPIDDTAPGTAVFELGAETFELEVVSCSFAAVVDPATNVSTDLLVTAAGDGIVVEVRQETFTAAAVTVTESVKVDSDTGEQLVDSRRVDAGGRILDLRVPDAAGRLFERPDGTSLIADGRFGTVGARGPEPEDLDGRLVVRCEG